MSALFLYCIIDMEFGQLILHTVLNAAHYFGSTQHGNTPSIKCWSFLFCLKKNVDKRTEYTIFLVKHETRKQGILTITIYLQLGERKYV